MAFYFGLALSCTSLDEENIAVLNNVILALGHNLSSSLHRGFVSVLLESLVVEDNGLDECLFKICDKSKSAKILFKPYTLCRLSCGFLPV